MKSIVITSINSPTKAVRDFAEYKEYKLYVVGDKKTPADWSYPGVNYYSVEDQMNSKFRLSKLLPFNHYSRKMLGYLEAVYSGASIIIDTDDDNLPMENFGFPSFTEDFAEIKSEGKFVNIYEQYTSQKIWPRGLPLDQIEMSHPVISSTELSLPVGVWQGLANGDPDVDAIYRLTSDVPCVFNQKNPVGIKPGVFSPFNSQNTAFCQDLFALLYLPSTVTFRYTDILRSYIAQPIMWAAGYSLGFTTATVFQDRNEHDYFQDFVSEVPMYLTVKEVVEIVAGTVKIDSSVSENLTSAYEALFSEGVVQSDELLLLDSWLNDLDLCVKY